MPKTLSPELLKRVIYSKYLMQRAQILQSEGHELALACAVLAAHDAVEMLMRVVTDHLNAKSSDKFMGFWSSIESKKQSRPPLETAMDRLNHTRNGFKHKGMPPNLTTVVNDHMPNALSFCEQVSQVYLDLDYQSVSLADLIGNDVARERVQLAEKAEARNDIVDALMQLAIAFDELFKDARKSYGATLIGNLEGSTVLLSRRSVQDKRNQQIEKMAEVVDAMILGINPARYRRFKQTTPYVYFHKNKWLSLWRSVEQPSLTPDDYNFCHSFVIDFALRLLTP